MCGIFGIASNTTRGIDPEFLWFGTHRVRHRGPNDWGFVSLVPAGKQSRPSLQWRFWGERRQAHSYRLGLGSRRLNILDLSKAGSQPMNLPGTDTWIVFNGEIYNFLELRAELSAEYQFISKADTEVLLAAYNKWGSNCLARLNGMFAFAIWDGARRRLFLARDRFGEKPLYYSYDRDRFIFGSELKQFLEDREFSREIDLSALADFLLLSLQDHDERTFLRNVKQLPPAHFLEWISDTGELRGPFRYWIPEIAADLDTSRDREFQQKFPALLQDSIRLRLRSDVPVGICLSGGLDSTTICTLASSQMHAPDSLSAYTMAFPGTSEDESVPAAQVAALAKVRQVSATMDASSLWSNLHEFVSLQDGPTGGASNLASWQVFQAARADGCIVLLNGQGGDELFAGYDKFFFFWFQNLLTHGHWMRFAENMACYLQMNGLSKWNFAEGRRYFPQFLRKRVLGMWQFSLPEFRQHATERIENGKGSSLNQRLWLDLSRFSLPCLLHWEDRNSMAVGTEARLPFLDHRLVEAVLSTSAYTKLKSGYTKYALRDAMSHVLPPEICWQKQKHGFDTPARKWFKNDLAHQMEELLSKRAAPLENFLNTRLLAEHYRTYCRTAGETLTESDWFKLIGTSIWLDQLHSEAHSLESAMVAN
jgi:asparagine synthase (glutamine-hydrolysing)